MLQFLLGISGTGKTRRILDEMRARAEAKRRSLLLVPEQFTSSAEMMVYSAFGDALSAYVDVYSFTSFGERVLRMYGGVAVRTLTDAGRVVMVRRALDTLEDELPAYKSHRRSMNFCMMCADAIKELKTAGATGEILVNTSKTMGDDGEKLRELGLVFAAYDALIAGIAMDTADRVAMAAQRMSEELLTDTAVYLDNFDGFTAPQYAMLRKLLHAETCMIALCCDTLTEHEAGLGLFSPVRTAAQRVRRIAAREQVSIAVPIVLEQDLRHKSAGLCAINHLLASRELPDDATLSAEGFFVTPAQSLYDECKKAACTMASLAKNGMMYRDMAVICRTLDDCEAPLKYELGLAGIPYFSDAPTTLEHTALATFLRAALGMLSRGLSTELILRMLKTELCGYSADEIACLENYAYTWQLKAADWRAPFTKNPEGFGEMNEVGARLLAEIETVRVGAIKKISAFLSAAKNGTAGVISKEMYKLLTAFDGEKHTQTAVEMFEQGNQTENAQNVYRSWNTLMELLSQMESLLGEGEFSAQEYDELFLLLLRATDIGHVPQTQNAVMVTTADRMRLDAPKVCFVLGAAEGEFPKIVGYSGLLSHADRESLVRNGLEMPGSFENRTLLEQMFFYRALTAASDTLYISAIAPEAGGAPLSAVLAPICDVLCPAQNTLSAAQLAPTAAAALDVLGIHYREDTGETAAFAAALCEQEIMQKPLDAMELAAAPVPYAAQDKAALESLLGDKMTLSPTRVEQYYRCRFSYFLQYVLHIRPRKKAELSPMESGTLVHYILENVLREAGADFAFLAPETVHAMAEKATDAYVAANMPQAGVRFAYLIARLKKSVTQLLLYMQEEQAQSSFHPVAFEQNIGFDEEDISPMTLETPDGHVVRVVGQIDRVDVMQREGKNFVRVVDYKTGNKTFSLDEVYCGLDLQMLLYLFTLCNHGEAQYPNPVAAGVLYLKSDPSPMSMSREDALKPQVYAVDGLVLDDEVVLRGMDRECTGLFVPFSFRKDGKVSATQKLADLAQLGAIEKHIEALVIEMAAGLYAGEIDAVPLCSKSKSPCDVCDYMPVCRHERGRGEKLVTAPKNVFRTGEAGREQ